VTHSEEDKTTPGGHHSSQNFCSTSLVKPERWLVVDDRILNARKGLYFIDAHSVVEPTLSAECKR
jgi:hypothetical protein